MQVRISLDTKSPHKEVLCTSCGHSQDYHARGEKCFVKKCDCEEFTTSNNLNFLKDCENVPQNNWITITNTGH